MKYYLFLLILLFPLIYSCQNQSEEEQLLNETLAVHDEVMPEMQTIYELRKDLASKKGSLNEQEDHDKIQEIDNRMEELSQANDSMMQWMRNFNRDFEGDESLSRKEYLKNEKERITVVKEEMELAIKKANATLQGI